MEKEDLVETNEVSPWAVEKLGDAYTVQNENWDNQLEGVETQNNGDHSPEFGNKGDDILGNINPQAVQKLEGDAFTVQNEDYDREAKDVKILNVDYS